jgi:hypothetical protein
MISCSGFGKTMPTATLKGSAPSHVRACNTTAALMKAISMILHNMEVVATSKTRLCTKKFLNTALFKPAAPFKTKPGIGSVALGSLLGYLIGFGSKPMKKFSRSTGSSAHRPPKQCTGLHLVSKRRLNRTCLMALKVYWICLVRIAGINQGIPAARGMTAGDQKNSLAGNQI